MSEHQAGKLPESQLGDAVSDTPAHGWAGIDKTVFGVSLVIVVVVCILGIFFTEAIEAAAGAALGWITSTFGWLFILGATGFVAFSLVLAFGRYGNIPLSREGEETEFSTLSWIAMMFSAGMGIGLMFFGVYEPVTHLASPPPFVGAEAGTEAAASSAMAYTLFHWGLHPWAIYSVVGLALAYSTYRMGRGNLMSAPFHSLLGKERIEKGWGKPIDILAIICTKFGSATSLGLGALQIAAGLSLLRTGEFEENPGAALPIIIICVLTVGVVFSAASGVSRGIKWLSNTNMILAAVLLMFVFVVGPTVFILDLLPNSIGTYLSSLMSMSFHSAVFGGADWLASWTIFYWAWWISWTPFVGTFIARISRGRTIKEFVLGVLLVPTAVSIIWFTIFGGAGINAQLGGLDIAGTGSEAAGFFALLQQYPFFIGAAIVVMILTAVFFVSGADAGSLVLGTLSSRGKKEPWKPLVIMWAILTGAVAAVLLFVGGLGALQTFTILAATPFVLIIMGLCVALYADLRKDPLRQRRMGPVRGATAVPSTVPFAQPVETGAIETVDSPPKKEPDDK
ncbi:BCCT family transporter [Arthrobacter crystallopoietes]|jgi:choline/carnitine/betaine transport|uniref:Choline/carnitine/betaine transport n=1 Tax=Crystallibacter crystallopoietes TaxID=37928 RepID=A0A1H1DMD7_9MICC|nr:BCCT family transporter [Arthrobacter crystallopoietes]AUI50257.1 choline transporter [Arthrobacter crystallopoietes]SDQ77368.1 choline/carnitine/betaine transport [Arthrobacter crystallopoietes]